MPIKKLAKNVVESHPDLCIDIYIYTVYIYIYKITTCTNMEPVDTEKKKNIFFGSDSPLLYRSSESTWVYCCNHREKSFRMLSDISNAWRSTNLRRSTQTALGLRFGAKWKKKRHSWTAATREKVKKVASIFQMMLSNLFHLWHLRQSRNAVKNLSSPISIIQRIKHFKTTSPTFMTHLK